MLLIMDYHMLLLSINLLLLLSNNVCEEFTSTSNWRSSQNTNHSFLRKVATFGGRTIIKAMQRGCCTYESGLVSSTHYSHRKKGCEKGYHPRRWDDWSIENVPDNVSLNVEEPDNTDNNNFDDNDNCNENESTMMNQHQIMMHVLIFFT